MMEQTKAKGKRERKLRILLTNDDGIDAPGLAALAEELEKLGELLVIAPEREMSGSGHAFTKRFPLRLRKVYKGGKFFGYATSGTPADSVKLGLYLARREVDWVVSGLNEGRNAGVDIFYSGTVSGALEGAIDGFPAAAFSLDIQDYGGEPKFAVAAELARQLLEEFIARGVPPRVCLNVNIPNLERSEIRGIKVVRQALQRYEDHFEVREDPFGEPYFWLTGAIVSEDRKEETDLAALKGKEGVITITPLKIELTDQELLRELERWSWKIGS